MGAKATTASNGLLNDSSTRPAAVVSAVAVLRSLLLSASAIAKVGNPFGDLGVVRNDPAVRLVMLQRARGIPEIQVAQNGKVPVRIMKVGGLCQRRLITRARFRKLSLAPLHQTELVVGGGCCGFNSSALFRLASAWSRSPVRAYAMPRSMCAAR